jgi:hypothetical protein
VGPAIGTRENSNSVIAQLNPLNQQAHEAVLFGWKQVMCSNALRTEAKLPAP